MSAHADPTPLTTAFGLRVRALREERRWTQRELASAASAGASTVCKVERGAGTAIVVAERIATALGKSLAEMLAPVECETAEPEAGG